MTVRNLIQPIDSIQSLANQNDIRYGTIKETSIYLDFQKMMSRDQNSSTPSYWTKLWDVIEANSLETSYLDGFEKVEKDPSFAFLWDAPVIKFKIAEDTQCKLTTIQNEIFQRGYGIATQQSSPLNDILSLGILKYQDNGIMEQLINKWWEPSKVSTCKKDDENSRLGKANKMRLSQLLGPFVVLAGGTLVGSLIAIYEVYSYVNAGRPYPPRDPKKLPQIVGRDLNPYLSIQRRKNNDAQ